MIASEIFKSTELRRTYGASGSTDALVKVTREATAWINQYHVKVLHISTGITSVYAYVVVWYDAK